ncbi:MAG: roadblock/LC7 domain-containing protein [Nitrospinae bacterium]|nr:roadblock/LC7 domain-containing protein [Nitrospinota bacterium]
MTTSLKSALTVLCGAKNVRGGLIITKDGMIIESNIEDKKQAETLGAFMSHIALNIKISLKELGATDFTRYVLQSNKSRVFLVDLGKSVLVTLTDPDVDTAAINVAIYQAANQIKKSGRLDV